MKLYIKLIAVVALTNAFIQTKSIDESAAQGVYKPFELYDQSLYSRPDIGPTLRELQLEIGRDLPTAFSSLDMGDARLNLFSEIAEMMRRAEAPEFGGAPGPAVPPGCSEHETMDTALIPPVNRRSSSCREAYDQSVRVAFTGFRKTCRYARAAERFVEDQAPGVVTSATVSSLEGLISLSGEALTHVDLPTNMWAPDFKARLRTIIAKVRSDRLLSEIRTRSDSYQKVLSLVMSRPNCFNASPASLRRFESSVRRLQGELDSAKSYLADLDREGRSQAAADKRRLEALGRTRGSLPYPSLTDSERQLLTMYIGGIYWRMRGGGLIDEPSGTQATRYYYTYLPMGVLGELNGGETGKRVGQNLYFRLFSSWSQWMDMGRISDDRYYDLTFMTKRGRTQVVDSVAELARRGYDTRDMTIGGFQMGPCYFHAWDRLINIKIGANLSRPYSEYLEGPTAWGEQCTGAAISLGMSKSLLFGTRRR